MAPPVPASLSATVESVTVRSPVSTAIPPPSRSEPVVVLPVICDPVITAWAAGAVGSDDSTNPTKTPPPRRAAVLSAMVESEIVSWGESVGSSWSTVNETPPPSNAAVVPFPVMVASVIVVAPQAEQLTPPLPLSVIVELMIVSWVVPMPVVEAPIPLLPLMSESTTDSGEPSMSPIPFPLLEVIWDEPLTDTLPESMLIAVLSLPVMTLFVIVMSYVIPEPEPPSMMLPPAPPSAPVTVEFESTSRLSERIPAPFTAMPLLGPPIRVTLSTVKVGAATSLRRMGVF